MNRTLNIVCFLIFASALSVRAIDPVVPQIAADFAISTTTAALLAAAFAAYGLAQPVLGPMADAFGKSRMMIACLLLLAVSSFLSAVVTDFWLLFVLRILAGAACGGSFPGRHGAHFRFRAAGAAPGDDRAAAHRHHLRQSAGRGGLRHRRRLDPLARHVRDPRLHQPGGACCSAISACAICRPGERHPLDIRSVLSRNRAIFAIRAARICYATVALEALFLFGIFPYVAVLLAKAGEPRATIAGLVVAAFAVGGMVYSLSVRQLLRWLGQKQIMTAGGTLAALGLFIVGAGPAWPVQAVAFAAMGCGFYMLHASIQVYVTEFAPATRSSAVAFHTFSFFIGGGISPILYGIGLERLGAPVTLSIAGVAMVLIGAISAQLLVKPKPAIESPHR